MALDFLPFGNGANVLIQIQPLARAAATWAMTKTGSSHSFAGKIQSYGEDYTIHDADLTPMDSFLDNPVVYGATGTYTITEFESPLSSFAGGSGNVSVLRGCIATSFYACLAVQQGSIVAGTWTPVRQDIAVVKFSTSGLNGSRESLMRTANFQLIPYVSAADGTYQTNPILGDVATLATPFAFLP